MKKIISGLLVLLALLLPAVSRADGREGGAAGVWTVRAENGEVLCTLADAMKFSPPTRPRIPPSRAIAARRKCPT